MRRGRMWVLLALCAVAFGVGGYMVVRALNGEPDPTPTPEVEFSLTAEEANALEPPPAITPPPGDLGDIVNTSPIEVPAPGAVQNHIYIESVFVASPIVAKGVTARGEMALPTDLAQVGWLDSTAPLGAGEGSTLLAGHVTYEGEHGTLYLLGLIEPGASVVTFDDAGARADWVVTSIRNYDKQALPAEIFATSGDRMLTLVTCGGDIVRTEHGGWTYEHNIVVTAVPRS